MTAAFLDHLRATLDDIEAAGLFKRERLLTGPQGGRIRVAGSGIGSGTLTFKGRTYPFTLIGSLNGVGALATTQASGEVYKFSDPSQFPGAWIQGNGNLAVSMLANGELWLQNNHGVVMRLTARQAGITLSNGRYEIFIQMVQ